MCQAQYLYIYLAVFLMRLQDQPSHHRHITVRHDVYRHITVTRGVKVMIFNDKSKPHNLKVEGSNLIPATKTCLAIPWFYVAYK